MTWELVVVIISAAAAVCGIVFGARNNRRANDEQLREDAMSLARIEGKLDSANRGIDDMRVEVRTHGGQLSDLATRVARCEEIGKSAHSRIDKLDGGRRGNSD